MSRGFIPIYLLIGAVVLVALGGAYYFGKLSVIKPTATQTTTTASQPSTTTDLTVNWKTYTNSTYNYSLKYPSNWSITDRISSYKGGVPEVADAQFFNFDNKGDLYKGNWVEILYDISLDEQKINKINNQDFKVTYDKSEIVVSDFNNKKLYRVTTTTYERKEGTEFERGKLYRLYIPMNEGYIQLSSNMGMKTVLEQILSTFKFLDQQALKNDNAGLDDWNVIENKNGYTIRYPKSLTVFNEGYGDIDPSQANGISIQQKDNGEEQELLKIYVFDTNTTAYKFNSLKELAEINYKANTSDSNLFIRTIKPLSLSTLNGEQSYEYTIESKGFKGAWTGFLGKQGVIKIIIFTHNNKYYLIGYYDSSPFNQILSTFKFN